MMSGSYYEDNNVYEVVEEEASLLAEAQAAQSAAAASQVAAAAALTDFKTRYLGSFASDPTVDDAGLPLQPGAGYFNTATHLLRLWNGAAWQDLAPSGVATFNTRTGAVSPASGDYTVAQVTGAAPLASPALTGTPTAPTAAVDTNTTQIATMAAVLAQAGSATPLISGTASAGTSKRYSPQDHVHPTDTTRLAVSAAGTGYVAPNVTSALTAGFTSASVSAGTKSSGTYTFDPTAGAVQHVTNGGAHTFAPPATHGCWSLDYVNNASAGAITTSGWTKVDGDAFDTTNTHAFRCVLSNGNQGSYMSVKRLV